MPEPIFTISFLPSENYSKAEAKDLFLELQAECPELMPGGYYRRRGVGDLHPLVMFIVQGVGEVIFAAVLSAAWSRMAQLVRLTFSRKQMDQIPQIVIVIESSAGDSVLRRLDEGDNINDQLDGALRKLQTLPGPSDIWYDRNSGTWNTWEEAVSIGRTGQPNEQ